MSWVAWILRDLWFQNLICIDSNKSEITDNLEKKWIKVIIGHNLVKPDESDIIIYSQSAENSTEVKSAKNFSHNLKKPIFVMNYFEFLWEISKYFKTIGISWTNWKSSTTALSIFCAKQNLKDFWLGILWALVPDLNWNNYLINHSKKIEIKNIFESIFSNKEVTNPSIIKKLYFFVESCEYKRHFLNLDLDHLIITNANIDHTDYYLNQDDYNDAFYKLAQKTKKTIFIHKSLNQELKSKLQNNFSEKIIQIENKQIEFKSVFWEHRQINWNFTISLFKELWVLWTEKTIESFWWLRRRMELLWENSNWSKIFSDYGHVAESIEICYNAIRSKFPENKVVAIFQPHQIQRVIAERNKFPKSLLKYDEKIIFEIYTARENIENYENFKEFKNIKPISQEKIWILFSQKIKWKYIWEEKSILDFIERQTKETIIVIFSAWSLDYIIRNYISKKNK